MLSFSSKKILPIKHLCTYARDDFFVSSCNRDAYHIITKDNTIWPNNRLLLVGEKSSGKSHLTYIWQQLTNGIRWNYRVNNAKNHILKTNFTEFVTKSDKYNYKSQIVEDIDACCRIVDPIEQRNYEIWLCELINYCSNNEIKLLMTSIGTPLFVLGDLQSRIDSTYTVSISEPDVEIIYVLIQKHMYDRQIKIDPEAIIIITRYIIQTNISYKYIVNVINKIEESIIALPPQVKKITKTMVKNIIKHMSLEIL